MKITDDHIPPEAWDKICEAFDCRPSEARAALAAALAAWPGATSIDAVGVMKPSLILPLPQEKRDV
jgi:hypothetical protein